MIAAELQRAEQYTDKARREQVRQANSAQLSTGQASNCYFLKGNPLMATSSRYIVQRDTAAWRMCVCRLCCLSCARAWAC